ncbi:hypothetical protein CYMTET_46817 [Cymbomonas tetramitiformis]|uniref:Uncharacterized protein n=1 Tax=Cymbomonas tetramitiformis TaxID=36881 RepID=A0AAE0BVH0_9CHLO|nr:hypothetical protein CYMTET_46817 [Cymbomonas tetramitiformis]
MTRWSFMTSPRSPPISPPRPEPHVEDDPTAGDWSPPTSAGGVDSADPMKFHDEPRVAAHFPVDGRDAGMANMARRQDVAERRTKEEEEEEKGELRKLRKLRRLRRASSQLASRRRQVAAGVGVEEVF